MAITDRPARSRVASVVPASPPLAARHFVARLQFETDPSDLAADLAAGVERLVVVDARGPEAFAAGHIPGAINLPHATIDERLAATLDRRALHVTYCSSAACNASTRAAAALASLGVPVKELIGGLSAWTSEGHPVDRVGRPTAALGEVGETTACAC